jgi:hypothetical protein
MGKGYRSGGREWSFRHLGRMKWPGQQSLGIAVEGVIMGLEFRKEENGE